MTAVSFKGTIEGACLQAWEPRCGSWLRSSVVSDRLSQDNQGQQWPGPQGCTVRPRSPSPLKCSKSPAEANRSFRWPTSRGLSSSHLLTGYPPCIPSLTRLPHLQAQISPLSHYPLFYGYPDLAGGNAWPELSALWHKEIHENQDPTRAAVDAVCVCVSVLPPKPKASLTLELISDCTVAWTPEGHLFRRHLGCEQAGALDEVGEAAGWTWGGQPGLDAGNNGLPRGVSPGLQAGEDMLGRPWAWGVDPRREPSHFLTVHRTKRSEGGCPETECWGLSVPSEADAEGLWLLGQAQRNTC